MTRRIFIQRTSIAKTGPRYQATDETGRVLVANSRAPEFDAARVLLAEGVRGRLEVWRATATFASMILDIEHAAKFTVRETDRLGPVFVAWATHLADAVTTGASKIDVQGSAGHPGGATQSAAGDQPRGGSA